MLDFKPDNSNTDATTHTFTDGKGRQKKIRVISSRREEIDVEAMARIVIAMGYQSQADDEQALEVQDQDGRDA